MMTSVGKDNAQVFQNARLLWRGLLRLTCFTAFLAIVLFLSGGIVWWQGWVFLAVFFLQTLLMSLYLWRTNPEIFVARRKIQAGTKSWDKLLIVPIMWSFLAIFIVGGLDHQFRWSHPQLWQIVLGYILMTLGMFGSAWVCAVNKFAEPGVRIQSERGHHVVDCGPYAIVRHPMYGCAFVLFAGIALSLGSTWALCPAAAAILTLVVRTVFEDRLLQDELPGYRQYAGRIRYRLVPGVW